MQNRYRARGSIEIQPRCIVGLDYKEGSNPAEFGMNCILRAGSIIYGDVVAGDYFQTGHHVVIRENTVFGNHVVVGTNTVIDGNVKIGSFVKIESNCYLPTHMSIGSRVFLGPGITITNDRYPLKMRESYRPEGPTVEDGVTIGGGAVLLPGVCIGANSFIAAGAVVTRDVPPASLVIGVPGKAQPLPEALGEANMALSWRGYLR